jgi:hypothetical protein
MLGMIVNQQLLAGLLSLLPVLIHAYTASMCHPCVYSAETWVILCEGAGFETDDMGIVKAETPVLVFQWAFPAVQKMAQGLSPAVNGFWRNMLTFQVIVFLHTFQIFFKVGRYTVSHTGFQRESR